MLEHPAARLRAELLLDRNADGGWAYHQGKKSRLEPTALATMALSKEDDEASDALWRRVASLLLRWQRQDGHIVCAGSPEPNMAFNGQAALAYLYAREIRGTAEAAVRGPSLDKLLKAITETRASLLPLGQRIIEWLLRSSEGGRQDNSLRAWPWLRGTFSWVEPTCWCLLALKRARSVGHDGESRIQEGEAMLFNRCCRSGGWNYGNANVLGKDLPAYVSTTALALLALWDRREGPEIQRSVAFLRTNRLRERSGTALALVVIALRRYGFDAADVEAALSELAAKDAFSGNNATRALALCALTGGINGHQAFTF